MWGAEAGAWAGDASKQGDAAWTADAMHRDDHLGLITGLHHSAVLIGSCCCALQPPVLHVS